MKNRILLLPILLTLAACRHIPARAPSQEEIQREAPTGGLVRVTLHDATQPNRFTSYLVDVSRNQIVNKVDGSTREEMESLGSSSMKSASAGTKSFLISNVNVYTDCKNPETEPGCTTSPGAVNGDPHGGSGGGGDPTGHDPDRMALRVAALSFWSIRQVGIPVTQKQVTMPTPTRGQ
ncbi:hypothetical protein [Pyxidicoccus sp. MSG2]|uniref:hypothetical protein n=1 Tax=Pyxidicoccus sp. MSG2 TaxID=2996790 RepID=UPI00226F5127|nr:hypothetical protein [Pyxidicoccus sp. MSG2]MCY1021037.1 hypothetical protein [Pyxidicoccus sp. MSG2]